MLFNNNRFCNQWFNIMMNLNTICIWIKKMFPCKALMTNVNNLQGFCFLKFSNKSLIVFNAASGLYNGIFH